jgi:hypothetical protein
LEYAHTGLERGLGETVARHGRDHHIERVFGGAAMAGRVRKQGYYFQHFKERAGPTVGDDQGERVRAAAAVVYEVNV